MVDPPHYRSLLRTQVEGRPWIVAQDVLPACTGLAEALVELGADRVFCLAGARGVGDPPDVDRFPQAVLGIQGTSIMGSIRATQAAFTDLPADVRARLDDFDPDRAARVVANLFSEGTPLAGRREYGTRAPAWRALEDKTVIDRVWDEAGIPRAPSQVVAAEHDALRRAAAALDQGLGTVWVGDNREGFHGGAEYLRWVRNEAQGEEAAAFFAAHCDSVRVMPFLDGIPCSIHGLVFPDTEIALRPCEMVVFRVPGASRLAYAGSATFWDPPAADRDELRRAARAVGRHLRKRVGYRGFFTMDGVMTAAGFRPTELNPRFGAALGTMSFALPSLPLYLLHLAIVEGADLDWRPAALESLLVESADANRRARGVQLVEKRIEENHELAIVEERGSWRIATDTEVADATLQLGPNPMGGFLRVVLSPERTPIGPSVGPRVAGALRFASDHWGLGFPVLEPAPERRREG